MKYRLTKNGLPAGDFESILTAMNRAEGLERHSLNWKTDDELTFAFGAINKHGDRTEYEITQIKRKRA